MPIMQLEGDFPRCISKGEAIPYHQFLFLVLMILKKRRLCIGYASNMLKIHLKFGAFFITNGQKEGLDPDF